MSDLYHRSVEVILSNQHPSGSYVASPTFETYGYCWFRDGSFIAYAMDLIGENLSAAKFHSWVADVINSRSPLIQRVVEIVHQGKELQENEILHTRYALDGSDVVGEAWPNFQLDGLGTWLWELAQHQDLTGDDFPQEWHRAAGLVADYLTALWSRPCYDCWEEFPDKVHTYTLAAIYAGLKAHERISEVDHKATREEIKRFLMQQSIFQGAFVKYAGSTEVDSNLLGLATPYRLLQPDDPLMRATVDRISTDLLDGGGLHRYRGDTYYGGGEWVILTAWLGWYYVEVGEFEKARELLMWVESQTDEGGNLPEQVSRNLNDPSYLEPWRSRWGNIANPLLWSHAKHLILRKALG
jgi:GH15 family glucan-1,4-alpha-glucosidase